MILFLNKIDLLKEKLVRSPIGKVFPEFTGKDTYEEVSTFFFEKFNSQNKNKEKTVYCHFTCATDTTQV